MPHKEVNGGVLTFRLLPNDIHVWYVNFDDVSTSVETVLSTNERIRASAFRFYEHRHAYVSTRAVLRLLLARYLGTEPSDFVFSYGANRKPELHAAIHFNVSHTAGAALLGFSHMPLGVDIEYDDPNFSWEPVAQRMLSSKEQGFIYSQPEALRSAKFLRCWTRREAYVKALGVGLSGADGLGPMPDLVEDESGRQWTVRSLSPRPHYVGAVAGCGRTLALTCFEWSPNQLKAGHPLLDNTYVASAISWHCE